MKLYGVEDLWYEDNEKLVIESVNDVIVKVWVIGICGLDMLWYKKMGLYIKGMLFGYEFLGVVDVIGSDVMYVNVGDKVIGCLVIFCY